MTLLGIFRVVLGFWLAAWFVNAPGEPGFLLNFRDALAHPIAHDALPGVLTHPALAFAIYLGPLACLPALVIPHRTALRWMAGLLTGTSLLACLHLETCSDATFVTTFWVSLWLNWLAHNLDRRDRHAFVIGRGLAHAIVGLVFLGAVTVKLTAEYHDGEAFFGLYFQHGTGVPYRWLREHLSPAAYRELATWLSKGAIAAETMLAASPLLPTQLVVGLYATVMVAMMIARNYNLFSVLGAPLGLLVGAELMRRHEARLKATRRSRGLRGRARHGPSTARSAPES